MKTSNKQACYKACQKARKQSEELRQESESDLDMAQILELSEFKRNMIKKLNIVKKKGDNM